MTHLVLAYLDPGSSSMIVQLLLGGLAAVGVTLKLYWRRFMKLIGLRKEVEDPRVERNAAATANTHGSVADAEPVETTKR